MERRIEFYPSWDKRDPDPSKNYGVHGVDIGFYVIGDEGAVQFKLSTGWLVPTAVGMEDVPLDWQNHYIYENHLAERVHRLPYPMPVDLGYHSRTPRYEDHTPVTEDCELIGGRCYYDGSGLNAIPVYDKLIREGHEGVFTYLETYYKEVFDG